MTHDPIDQKWLDALADLYPNPLASKLLPYYNGVDGTIHAERTLSRYLELIGVKLDPVTGRIGDPDEHPQELG